MELSASILIVCNLKEERRPANIHLHLYLGQGTIMNEIDCNITAQSKHNKYLTRGPVLLRSIISRY